MSELTQATFIVERDGQLDTELSVLPPTGLEIASVQVRDTFQRMAGHIALQTRMAVFDTIHHTNYRHIRNELVEQHKRERFERSIGIERK